MDDRHRPAGPAVRPRRHPPVARRRPRGGVQGASWCTARPTTSTTHALRWDGLGPWKRVVVCAEDGDDDPDDVIESVIDVTIPDERAG